MRKRITLITVILVLLTASNTFSEGLDTWRWRNPLPQGNVLSKVAFGNGIFVSLAPGSAKQSGILTSSNGITWKEQAPLPIGGISGLAFGSGVFVVVGNQGAIFSSRDGAHRRKRPTGAYNMLSNIAFGNGSFVVVGDCGMILTSRDGVTWSPQSGGTGDWLYAVAYGNGRFIAYSNSGDHCITSPDGISWTPDYTRDGAPWIFETVYAGRQFVAVCPGGLIYTSPDGLNWTQHATSVQSDLFSIAFARGVFVAVGSGGGSSSPPPMEPTGPGGKIRARRCCWESPTAPRPSRPSVKPAASSLPPIVEPGP